MGTSQKLSKNGSEPASDWPLISVVTCFLNVEEFLEESIQSVIAQKYANWELLLVDDGSTDKSTEIAKSFSILKHILQCLINEINNFNQIK